MPASSNCYRTGAIVRVARAILADLQSLRLAMQPLALRRTAPTPPEVFGICMYWKAPRLGARVQLGSGAGQRR